MWKATLTVYALLASSVLAQQQILSDAAVIAATGNPSTTRASREPAINAGVKTLAEKLVRQAHIPGLSIGVVHSDNSIEAANWGIRSESRECMTTDVNCLISKLDLLHLAGFPFY